MQRKFDPTAFLIPSLLIILIFTGVLMAGGPIIPTVFTVIIILVIFFAGSKSYRAHHEKQIKTKYGFLQDQNIFNNSIMIGLAYVIQADGKNSSPELKFIRAALAQYYTDESVNNQLTHIQNLANRKKLDINQMCRFVAFNYRFAEKIQLLHFLIGIVTADGLLTATEEERIAKIARGIKIPPNSLTSIYRMFNFVTEEDVKNRRKRKEEKKVRSSTYQLNKSFEILGLQTNATDKEIKKAYRKLAKLHHPDKLIHLGEEHQKTAKEKFQAISDAYEYLKSVKGFS